MSIRGMESSRGKAAARSRARVWAVAPVGALVSALACMLSGCANLVFLAPKPAAEAPRPAPNPDRAVYEIEIAAPTELQPLLKNYLDLSRFQSAPETEGITSTELDRLVVAAPAQARALLETEGYFEAEVKVTRSEGAKGMPLLRVQVDLGPRTLVEQVALDVAGPLKDAVDSGDAQAAEQLAALRKQWPLPPGQPFRQSAWSNAKNTLIANLRAEGYPASDWQSTLADVDAPARTARLSLVADSGPLFKLGAVKVEGLERHDETSVTRLATFGPGTRYSDKLLLDFQERLQRLGLFEGASVEIDPNSANAEAAEVRVRVKELPLQQATIGVGYSANTGQRLTLEHTARRVFDLPWIAKNKFELGRDLNSWQGDLTSHPLDGLYRNLLGGNAERLNAAGEIRTSWSARIGRTQDTPRIERLYYFEYVHSRLDTLAGNSNDEAVSYNYHWVYRDIDSVLLPTLGATYSAQGAVGFAGSTTQENGPFSRAYGRATWYRPLGAAWYATVRAEAGEVFAADNVGIPDTLLFRAGGDESVRGYSYRTLGPAVDGVITGGRVLFTGSAELARPISALRPAFWWAVFVDAGNAAKRWNELTPALGYGVGLRWRSPVGPLRLDLAYGQQVHKARVHLSVGIAF
jgi:translocation and assembly module TamA